MITWRKGREILTAQPRQPRKGFWCRRSCDEPERHQGSPRRHASPAPRCSCRSESSRPRHWRCVPKSITDQRAAGAPADRVGDARSESPTSTMSDRCTVRSGWGAGCSRSSTSRSADRLPRARIDVPADAGGTARKRGLLARNLDLEHASFFVSRMTIVPTRVARRWQRWRKALFVFMARNSSSPLEQFHLPLRPHGSAGLPGGCSKRLRQPAPARSTGISRSVLV